MASERKKIRGAIVKKDEKALNVLALLGDDKTEQNFISKFMNTYPDDCKRYNNAYQEQEKLRKPGQTAPMSKIEVYLINLYKKMNK